MKYQMRLFACSLLLLSPAASLAAKKPAPKPQASSTAITPDAAAFLDNAIDIMRQHALHGQGVDWTEIRTEAFKRGLRCVQSRSTHIRRSTGPWYSWAILGSHLRLPPSLYPDQIALLQQAEKKPDQRTGRSAMDNSIPTAFTSRRMPEGHVITMRRGF